jgi:hypothetical protein
LGILPKNRTEPALISNRGGFPVPSLSAPRRAAAQAGDRDIERGLELLHPGGRLGAITSRTGFFLSSYRRWREEIVLGIAEPEVMADLGHGVMDDAMVEAAAYVLRRRGS